MTKAALIKELERLSKKSFYVRHEPRDYWGDDYEGYVVDLRAVKSLIAKLKKTQK